MTGRLSVFTAAFALLPCFVTVGDAQPAAPAFSALYTFAVPHTDGALVEGPLAMGTDGALYGTAEDGGAMGYGTVFKLTPPQETGGSWQHTTLYSFAGGTDGAGPGSGVIFSPNGYLYGTTMQGGAPGFGTVFQLQPPTAPGDPWTEQVIYGFMGGADGAAPYAGLAVSKDGTLYGATYENYGGDTCNLYGCGTVFQLSPPSTVGGVWTESVIYSFSGPDGTNPYAALSIGSDGALYGTTRYGGAGYGTVFQLSPPTVADGAWTETVLHNFAGAPDGSEPAGALLISANGTLYGTAATGGDPNTEAGIAFTLSPPAVSGGTWTETIIYTFGGVNGARPSGPLTPGAGGILYGTTAHGGANRIGTVYELSRSASGGWTETVLNGLSSGEGSFATGGVIVGPNGVLYGAATDGPIASPRGYGVVFEIVP
jgi:uncharacterized repeat protein (TIGR03803 family)